jgi:hypothetical protein
MESLFPTFRADGARGAGGALAVFFADVPLAVHTNDFKNGLHFFTTSQLKLLHFGQSRG